MKFSTNHIQKDIPHKHTRPSKHGKVIVTVRVIEVPAIGRVEVEVVVVAEVVIVVVVVEVVVVVAEVVIVVVVVEVVLFYWY